MSKITKIEVQKKNKSRVNIYVDEEFTFACDAELVYTYRLKINEEIDVDKIMEIAKEDNFKKAKRDALRIIEKSYKTEKEVYKKLVAKGYEEPMVNKAIEFLDAYNFVDDEKYAKAYVKDKIKVQGRDKISYSLAAKGIDSETIKETIASIDGEDEFEGAKKLGIKKYEALVKRESDTRKIQIKLKQFLASKGYSFEMIRRVCNSIQVGEDSDIFED
jgi:regulatory protein